MPGLFRNLGNLTFLNLQYQKITHLRPESFQGLQSIVTIDLSGNNITTPQELFSEHTNLQELYLDRNRVTELRKGMFNNLHFLISLRLQSNQMTTIEGGTFSHLFRLERLDLSQNLLTGLIPGIFHGLESIRFIGLSSNRLTTVSSEVFEELPRPLEIGLYGNPMRCDQNLCWIKHEQDSGSLYTSPRCACGSWYRLRCQHGGELTGRTYAVADLHSKILDTHSRSKFLLFSCSFWKQLAE